MHEADNEDDIALRVLTAAGWFPGRCEREQTEAWVYQLAHNPFSSEGNFEVFQSAVDALLEFGGLDVVVSGPGVDFAKTSFRIDPTVAVEDVGRFEYYASKVGFRLYPLGEINNGYAFIAIDEMGRVYVLMDDIKLMANSMHEAAKRFILGKKAIS